MKTTSLIAVLLLASASAHADTASDAADKAAAGKKAFAEGKYAEAIAAFRAANALQADPKLIYAIAQAQRMAGDCAGAIVSYEEFIKTNADEKLVEYSTANIARCKEQLASGKPVDPKPVDPKPVDPKPTDPKPVDPKPTDPVNPVVGTTTPPITDPPPPRDTPQASWKGDWIGHGLVGGGVIAAAVGLVVWSGARSDASAVGDATTHEEFLAARDAADGAVTKQRIGLGVALAGVALVGVGIYHYTTVGNKEVRVGAAPAASGGTLFARWSF